MVSGQSFSDAVKNTFTDKTSLAIIGTSTLIGAATSGVSGLAVNATAKSVSTAASLGLKSGVQAVGKLQQRLLQSIVLLALLMQVQKIL